MKKALFLLFLIIAVSSKARVNEFQHFREVSPSEGFTYSAVQSIAEDELGFIWFGTQHGLYRYNTVEITKYLNQLNDPNSIPGSNVRNLYPDKAGKLWIATATGLCYYDYRKDRFIRCQFGDSTGRMAGINIYQVLEDRMDQLWLIDDAGLAKVDTVSRRIQYLPAGTGNGTVRVARMAENGIMWLGTTNGTILRLLPPYTRMEVFGKFRQAMVQAIWPSENALWIGYEWNGADKIDYSGYLLAHYNMEGLSDKVICHARVRDIYESDDKKIWIATFKGISIISGDDIMNYSSEDLNGISYSSIYKFFEDSQNGLWVGSWSGGLFYHNPNDHWLWHIKNRESKSQDINVISSFTEDKEGTIWVGSEMGILYSYNSEFQETGRYKLQRGNLNITNIKSLYTDSQGNVWMGTFAGGIWLKKPGNQPFVQLPILENTRASIYGLSETSEGMWIATYNNGLYLYDLQSGQTQNFRNVAGDSLSLSNSMVRSLLTDQNGHLWIGTLFGLNRYDRESRSFKRYFSGFSDYQLSDNEIFSLIEDRRGFLWIGTGNGLNRLDPSTGIIRKYYVTDGLAGNEIYGLAEDTDGNLWISTQNGISCHNPKTGSFRNFDTLDGLQGRQFNPGASYGSKRNFVLFGGNNGFNVIFPGQVRYNPIPPRAVLTSLVVNNQPAMLGEKNSPLKESLPITKELVLKARQNSISLTFVATNFLLPEKNRFRYRLLNYNDDWMEAGIERKATFTKIPPGKYVFEVLACNNDGVWSQEPTSLDITIQYPFWLRWYAFLFYGIVMVTIAYFLDRELNLRRQLRLEILRGRMEREQEEKLTQAKLRFFINISHEFRTPLTLILSPLKRLHKRFGQDPEASLLFQTVNRNAVRMQKLIDQVIDMRKINSNLVRFVPEKFDLVALCREVVESFRLEANEKGILLHFDPEFAALDITTDPEKIDKVLFNLVSNAVKFTGNGGFVTISLKKADKYDDSRYHFTTAEKIDGSFVEIVVKDDGITIPPENIENMFDLFVQGDHPGKMGTGIGLHLVREYTRIIGGNISVRSTAGKGTEMALRIPVSEKLEVRIREEDDIPPPISLPMPDPAKENGEPSASDHLPMILIVDDNSEMRQFLETTLKSQYRIINAGNGKIGFEKALVARPDLIISDVQMPVADGFALNRLLKENPLTQGIPVIFLTGYPLPDLQSDSLLAGVDAVLIKPFNDEVLMAQISNLISGRKRILAAASLPSESLSEGDTATVEQFMLDRVVRTIEKNMYNPSFGVDSLADELNMSRTSLYRKLKQLTGQSATEFVRSVRLKAALAYLEKGKLSIEEAGNAVGFNSPSYFTHCFRMQYGKTPSEYLKEMRGKG